MEKRKAKYIEFKTGILTVETSIIHNKLMDYENFFFCQTKTDQLENAPYRENFSSLKKSKFEIKKNKKFWILKKRRILAKKWERPGKLKGKKKLETWQKESKKITQNKESQIQFDRITKTLSDSN